MAVLIECDFENYQKTLSVVEFIVQSMLVK